MKKRILIVVGLLMLVYVIGGLSYNMGRRDVGRTANIYDLWVDTNNERTTAGLAPLNLSPELNQSAADKCADMVAKHYWAHDAPDGTQPWVFITKTYGKYRDAGENLYYTDNTPYTSYGTVYGWMNSPEHKANILKDTYTDVGFGLCSGDLNNNGTTSYLTVQHFASK